jgi:Fic family protein
MKAPQKPKPLPKLLDEHSGKLSEMISAGLSAVVKGKYVHWDKLRHLDPPANLNHEEWWLGIKLARSQLLRDTPLTDASGTPFRYAMPDCVLEMLHEIDSKARGSIELPEQVTNRETRDRYIVRSLMEEAITSSQLEGASTTRQVAADMIRSGRKPKDNSEQMIVNNYRAIQSIRDLKGEALTPEKVLELHRVLTEKTLDDPTAAGRLQLPGEKRVHVADNATQAILHSPPPAEQLPERLEKMCNFTNGISNGGGEQGFIHPIIRSIILHFWLAYDHPFLDGNGRTARALFYWSMLSQGYWLFEYVSISRILKTASAKYGKSYLMTETDDNDMTYFIIYQLEVMLRAISDFDSYLQRKIEQVREIETQLKHASRFNQRQLALLSHATRHPSAEYTIASHQSSHNVAYATARSDLLELVDNNLLQVYRIGKKKQIFIVPENLQERLQEIA